MNAKVSTLLQRNLRTRLCVLLLTFVAFHAATFAHASTATLTVTSLDGSKSVPGSLLAAIYQADYGVAGVVADKTIINFNIPNPLKLPEVEIVLTETLFLNRPITIDATTQPGYAGQPLIRINCAGLMSGIYIAGPDGKGLPGGGGSTIKGLRITGYTQNAITVAKGADGNMIADNQLGYTPLGGGLYLKNTTIAPECRGIGIQSNSNEIARNTICGVYNPITLGDDIGSPSGAVYSGNSIHHNFIGTDPTGSFAIGNDSDGVFLGAGAQNTVIGPGNVIGGMGSAGVELLHPTATGNLIFGNHIGVNAAGTDVIPNGDLGVLIANGSSNNIVGGPNGGNVIAGNVDGGVAIGTDSFPQPCNNNLVEGNLIGVDAAQTKAIGSQIDGVIVQNGGSGNVVRKNVIGGHVHHGIVLASGAHDNALYGNWIGVTAGGVSVPNAAFGVAVLYATHNNIVQLPAASAAPGSEQNIFGSNGLGLVYIDPPATGNIVDLSSLPPLPTPTPASTPTPAPTATPISTGSPSQLLNLSTRKQVGTGDNVLIGGFIVVGTQGKNVIVRGLGPSLTAAGVNGAMPDPTLELHNSTSRLFANDNWQDQQAAAITATGIPPSNPLEAAIIATLPANPVAQGGAAYTGILAGNNSGTGIGLLEIYDLDTTAASKLANISTRGFVGTSADDYLIGGFIPGPDGRGQFRVLVRALGPSLAQSVSGALQDPVLELHDSNGNVIQSNDNWQTAANAADVQATGIPPSDPREAAIVTTLAPNTGYTAVVRGANGTSGVGLVEVYDLN